LGENFPVHQTFHLTQLLGEHLLSDGWDTSAQLVEAQLAFLEPPKDQDFPPARNHVKSVLDGTAPVDANLEARPCPTLEAASRGTSARSADGCGGIGR
jgi:hypothetical protein